MNIKILGSGCAKCIELEKKVKLLVDSNLIDAEVQKITEIKEILKYGILSTPGIVINERVMSYGSIPKDEQILSWIGEAKANENK